MAVVVLEDTEPELDLQCQQQVVMATEITQLRLALVALAVQVGRLISVQKDMILYFPQSLQQVVDTAVQVALVA